MSDMMFLSLSSVCALQQQDVCFARRRRVKPPESGCNRPSPRSTSADDPVEQLHINTACSGCGTNTVTTITAGLNAAADQHELLYTPVKGTCRCFYTSEPCFSLFWILMNLIICVFGWRKQNICRNHRIFAFWPFIDQKDVKV